MNYEQMTNNKVMLRGKVVTEPAFSHEVMGEGFYDFKVSVPRLSGQEDIINVTVSERIMDGEEIKPGNIVSINGQYRSYNKLEEDRSRLLLTCFVREFIQDEGEYINHIELTGHICKQPVYRMTPFKREICDVLIAVNRAYNKSDYIPCIAWGRNAKFIKNLAVGEKITVAGRIQSREYHKVSADGTDETRTAYEISLSKVSLLDENGGVRDKSVRI